MAALGEVMVTGYHSEAKSVQTKHSNYLKPKHLICGTSNTEQ